jgi:hypothetical protein
MSHLPLLADFSRLARYCSWRSKSTSVSLSHAVGTTQFCLHANAESVAVLFLDCDFQVWNSLLRRQLRHESALVGNIPAERLRQLIAVDASFLRCARVQEYVIELVFRGPGTVCSGEVLPGHKRIDPVLFLADDSFGLQFGVNPCIDLSAGAIVGRNN